MLMTAPLLLLRGGGLLFGVAVPGVLAALVLRGPDGIRAVSIGPRVRRPGVRGAGPSAGLGPGISVHAWLRGAGGLRIGSSSGGRGWRRRLGPRRRCADGATLRRPRNRFRRAFRFGLDRG